MTKIKIIIISTLAIVSISICNGQNYEDIPIFSQLQYSGTARSIAMGGAFGSLGGDYSSIGINPAGIAAYRSSEFTFTPSLTLNNTKSNYKSLGGTSFDNISSEDNITKLVFNQIGAVWTYRPIREVKKGLISSHLAIGYNRNNNFNYKSLSQAKSVTNSMTDFFIIDANNNDQDYWDGSTYLAYQTYLINPDEDNYYTNYLAREADLYDLVDQSKLIKKNGYAGEINISSGANISNFILVGASLNISLLNYSEDIIYHEKYSDNNDGYDQYVFNNYSVKDYLDFSGSGINLKLGVIILPFKNFRLGIAYHSPTWYNMEEEYGTRIEASFFNEIPEEGVSSIYDYYKDQKEYNFRTPDKLIASASYIFGKHAILSFDYERINYSNSKFKSSTDNFDYIDIINANNMAIKNTYTVSNNFRTGLEYRINKQISLRAGYSFQGTPYKDKLYKEASKDNEITSYTAGLGYRFGNYFFDIAYKLSSYDINYYNYNWDTSYDEYFGAPPIVKTNVKDSNIVFTFGVKY